uniref:Uncharacterized protein n=1 Tax=Panagrolaimus sp. JU765 TaxID=591449 RepID=A0AC34RCI7_9BILA
MLKQIFTVASNKHNQLKLEYRKEVIILISNLLDFCGKKNPSRKPQNCTLDVKAKKNSDKKKGKKGGKAKKSDTPSNNNSDSSEVIPDPDLNTQDEIDLETTGPKTTTTKTTQQTVVHAFTKIEDMKDLVPTPSPKASPDKNKGGGTTTEGGETGGDKQNGPKKERRKKTKNVQDGQTPMPPPKKEATPPAIQENKSAFFAPAPGGAAKSAYFGV